ncbi:MAG TPA: hypothetical protein VNN10_00275 [Dehalococcoidia bacterium]|nr:hypothetical protein [Dehalococcoidia bacterium]
MDRRLERLGIQPQRLGPGIQAQTEGTYQDISEGGELLRWSLRHRSNQMGDLRLYCTKALEVLVLAYLADLETDSEPLPPQAKVLDLGPTLSLGPSLVLTRKERRNELTLGVLRQVHQD